MNDEKLTELLRNYRTLSDQTNLEYTASELCKDNRCRKIGVKIKPDGRSTII